MSELQPLQASVVATTRALAQVMGEMGLSRLRYVAPGGDEIWEMERGPHAPSRPSPYGVDVPSQPSPYGADVSRPIPRDEDAFLDNVERSEELRAQEQQREDDALQFAAVGVVPEPPAP